MGGESADLLAQALSTPADPGLRGLVALEGRLECIADDVVDAIWRELPAFAQHPDPGLSELVRASALEAGRLAVRRLAQGSPVAPDELAFIRRGTRVPMSGIAAPEVLRAYHVSMGVVWRQLADLADATTDAPARSAMLAMIGRILDLLMTIMGVHVSALHEHAARTAQGGREHLDRDLFEQLLAGTTPAPGEHAERFRRAGLRERSPLVVVSTQITGGDVHAVTSRRLATAARRAIRSLHDPLTVTIDDEVVLVVPVADTAVARNVVEQLRGLGDTLADLGADTCTGISTVHEGVAGVGAALAEARAARERSGRRGCVAFCQMSAIEYLVSQGDATAQRMVREPVRDFVQEDLARGGDLVMTLQAYADADLNATLAAERLHMHVNTVRYRLARIEERAGCDLRRLADVLELLVAARLHGTHQRAAGRVVSD